jgi:hypothetical protein
VSTSTLIKGPVARNVFVVEPADKKAQMGEPLLFGQNFRLRLNSVLQDNPPLYLFSQASTPFSFSKITRHAEVCVSAECTYDTVFHAVYKDLTFRLEMEGQPVPANTELCIFHNNTRKVSSQLPSWCFFFIFFFRHLLPTSRTMLLHHAIVAFFSLFVFCFGLWGAFLCGPGT